MLFSDKAFAIWMGHAGEDTQAFVQEDQVIDSAAFERTQVLAIVRRDVQVADAVSASRTRAQDCEPHGLAA